MGASLKRVIGSRSSNGRYARVVDSITIYGQPIDFRSLCEKVVSPSTRYLVLDLDRTVHFGRNVGELLGWELIAHQAYGGGFWQETQSRRGTARFLFDWHRPWVTARYVLGAARLWAYPGLLYLACVKWGMRSELVQRWIYERFGLDPVEAVQEVPRTALMHQLADIPIATLHELVRAVWKRLACDQVITRADITWLRARCANIKIIISSASPKPVLDVAAEMLGVDDVFFSDVDEHDGYLNAPFLVDRLFLRFRDPRRMAPPSRVTQNAGETKLASIRARYPDFCDPNVETVGMTDTSYGEDHGWAHVFTKVVDVNSPTPFAPIVAVDSPLREIHSAKVLTQGEIQQRKSGDATYLDPRRKCAGIAERRCFSGADLSRMLDKTLCDIETLAAESARLFLVSAKTTKDFELQVAKCTRNIENAVAVYNETTGRARQDALRRLRKALQERARVRREMLRVERPLALLGHTFSSLLTRSRLELERMSSDSSGAFA